MKTLPVVKCTVSTDEKEVDVSRWIDEYDMLETLLSRDKTSGVLATVTFPVNFVSYAKDYVKSLFEKDGLYAKARFNVYLREDYGVNYNLVKSTALDFSTYKEETERVTVECAEEELSQLINSEGKTKYEILVDKDIKSDKQWDYQRMNLLNLAEYTLPISDKDGGGIIDINEVDFYAALPLTQTNVEQIPGDENDLKSESLSYNPDDSFKPVDYFFKSYTERTVALEISINLAFECTGRFSYVTVGQEYLPGELVRLAILKFKEDGSFTMEKYWPLIMSNYRKDHTWWYADYKGQVGEVFNLNINKGERLSFVLAFIQDKTLKVVGSAQHLKCQFTRAEHFKVQYRGVSNKPAKIDVIDPVKLMQKYLDEMSGKKGYFSVDIQWKEKEYKTMIVAAESIRQMPKAKIYGSPRDFFEWMKVLGYEYECIDRKLIFKPRDEFFKKNVSAMGLRAHELADLIVQADQTYAYTSVEIGYDKQDYESTNGRCEANGTFCYTTGFIARKDNKLSLISPYRADSMGIEFLCQENDKKSTDTKSDKDVFFVALNDSGNYYTEYKGIEIVDKDFEIKMFNAPFNPYFLIQRNESLIGINAKQVKFKSTDMSGTAELSDETNIYKDQQITQKLFEPIEYNFAAGHWQKIPVPEKRNGLIYFEWQGKMLKGFIKEIRKNYACETETTWLLWAVK